MFVLIDCNAASQNVILVISGAVWERTYKTAGGGDCGQPEVLVPLQVDPSTIER